MRRRPRIVVAALATLALIAIAAPLVATSSGPADRPAPVDVVLVTTDCATGNFLCGPFVQATKRTGARGRIISPDPREDLVGTLSLLAEQGHDLIIVDPTLSGALSTVAPRFPDARFALIDAPLFILDVRAPNETAVLIRPRESAFLAGWLAARLERRRRGPDVVGIVAGKPIVPVEEFVIGIRAGAQLGSPGVTVLTDYSHDFTDPTRCAALARRQIARGAGTVLDVAGGCGPGTLAAARDAGVWGVGVDLDRSRLGPHILTSMVKRYDRGFATLIRQLQGGRLPLGRTTLLGLRRGGTELGRISRRVPDPVLAGLAAVRRAIVSGRIRVPGPVIPGPEVT